MIDQILNGLAAVSAFVAAVLWIKATRAEIAAPEHTSGVGSLMGGYLITENAKGDRIDLHETYKEQAKWNSRAAWATGLTAALAGAALALKALGELAT